MHHATAKEAAFKAELIHRLASGLSQVGGCYRVGNAQGYDELILPKERTAVEVEARSLDDVVAIGPFCQARDGLRKDEHVVVHDPEPLCPQLVGALNAGRKAAGAARVLKLRGIDHAVEASLGIRFAIAAPKGGTTLVEFRHHLFGGGGVLVVNDYDAPGSIVKCGDGIEKVCEHFLALIGDHDEREALDGRCVGASCLDFAHV